MNNHANKEVGGLYTHTEGYHDEDITWWEGRRVAGVSVGVIQFPANVPMPPGDIGNASTFNFPLLYEPIDVDPFDVVTTTPTEKVADIIAAAGKKLEMQGCRSIIGNCGFFGNYQSKVARKLNVPFYSSSLMQVPMILGSLGPEQKVGILTAAGSTLTSAPALNECGITDSSRVVIYGADDGAELQRIMTEKGRYNLKRFELELVALAKKMVNEHPDIGTILLECTEMSPHAFAVQDAVRLPVWDFTTMVNWIHLGAVRQPFKGFI